MQAKPPFLPLFPFHFWGGKLQCLDTPFLFLLPLPFQIYFLWSPNTVGTASLCILFWKIVAFFLPSSLVDLQFHFYQAILSWLLGLSLSMSLVPFFARLSDISSRGTGSTKVFCLPPYYWPDQNGKDALAEVFLRLLSSISKMLTPAWHRASGCCSTISEISAFFVVLILWKNNTACLLWYGTL